MEYFVIVCLAVNVYFLYAQLIVRRNGIRQRNKWQSDQLKYQKHLRNTYDYLGLMQKAMSEGDEVTFIACSSLVAEELAKCTEIINN